MKISFILFFLLSLSANTLYASFDGNYTLVSGPDVCPEGNIVTKTDKKDLSRVIMFGSQLSWTLSQSDKDELKEAVPEGCTYTTHYQKSENSFSIKTDRTSCPDKKENSVINELLEFKKEKLYYHHDQFSQNKKASYDCTYKRNI